MCSVWIGVCVCTCHPFTLASSSELTITSKEAYRYSNTCAHNTDGILHREFCTLVLFLASGENWLVYILVHARSSEKLEVEHFHYYYDIKSHVTSPAILMYNWTSSYGQTNQASICRWFVENVGVGFYYSSSMLDSSMQMFAIFY